MKPENGGTRGNECRELVVTIILYNAIVDLFDQHLHMQSPFVSFFLLHCVGISVSWPICIPTYIMIDNIMVSRDKHFVSNIFCDTFESVVQTQISLEIRNRLLYL